MAKKEVTTDLWVHDLLKEAGIELDAQGSEIKEINEALKTASKRGTGKVGFPEYVGVVKDFIIVIEDKAKLENHIKETENGAISTEISDVTDYAVNGALFYAKHLIKNTNFAKAIAIGVSGNEKRHRITPLYVEDTEPYTRLNDIESFINFNEKNIQEYYEKEILHEDISEKKLKEILDDAEELNKAIRVYSNLQNIQKPILVSGILLALDEIENGTFSINSLVGDKTKTDGEKIFDAIKAKFERNPIKPEKKRDKVLSQFNIIKDSEILNSKNEKLAKTPLKYFAEFLYEKIYKAIKYTSSSEDYLGRFYSEFMSYGGGDGKNLGIVLTPKHITDLFCDLVNLQKDDVVLDPCCGTAGFLVAAMHHMLEKAEDETDKIHIRQQQLHGIEIEDYMFTIAVTNMILRGDGKSNIENKNFFDYIPGDLQRKGATVGMINPPYSMAEKNKNSEWLEINFIFQMLNSLTVGARGIAIVPQSTMTGGASNIGKQIKAEILKHHTLEGTIMLQKETFDVGVVPCIAIFTAGVPHNKEKVCKFINFEDDGFKVSPHIGLLETESAKDKKQHLLDVWFDRIEAPTKFCVKTTITAEDEWLHSFYYFNDEIPTDTDFEKTVGDYLTFEFSMIMQGRKYLFENAESEDIKKNFKYELTGRKWKEFFISGDEGVFKIEATSSGIDKNKLNSEIGNVPYITRSDISNGVNLFVSEKQKKNKDFGNSITIGLDTQTVFYQPYNFYTGQNIQVLTYENCSKSNALFIIKLIQLQMVKFNWGGNGATLGRLSRTKILLPINDAGEIDYDFMEAYIKEIENKKLEEYRKYALKRLEEIGSVENTEALEDKEWKPFEIAGLFEKFEQGKSKGLNHLDEENGTTPYLGATNRNNGILTFIKDCESKKQKGNCIGFIRNGQGSVGYAIYKKEEFVSTSDNTFAYADWLNNYNGLFVVASQDLIRSKYSFGYKRNNERLKKDKILLPIDSSGNPDYDYMEKYIKKLMLSKYSEYLEFKHHKREYPLNTSKELLVADVE